MMRLALALFIGFLALPQALALGAVFLPDPVGSDNGREYVLLLEPISLANCTVSDSSSSDSLMLTSYNASSNMTAIIEEDSNETILPAEIWAATRYHAGAAIGNGLGNTIDSLYILCNGATVLNLSYNIPALANYSEGTQLSWNGSAVTVFVEMNSSSDTTAVVANTTMNATTNIMTNMTMNGTLNITSNATLDVSLNQTTNATINNTFNVTVNNTLNTTLNSTVNATTNMTINITYANDTTNASCVSSVAINITNQQFQYDPGTKILFRILHDGDKNAPYSYWIDDLEGNTRKSRVTSTTATEKSYTIPSTAPRTIFTIHATIGAENACAGAALTATQQLIINGQEIVEEETMIGSDEETLSSVTQQSVTISINDVDITNTTAVVHALIINGNEPALFTAEALLTKETRPYTVYAGSATVTKSLVALQEENITLSIDLPTIPRETARVKLAVLKEGRKTPYVATMLIQLPKQEAGGEANVAVRQEAPAKKDAIQEEPIGRPVAPAAATGEVILDAASRQREITNLLLAAAIGAGTMAFFFRREKES